VTRKAVTVQLISLRSDQNL